MYLDPQITASAAMGTYLIGRLLWASGGRINTFFVCLQILPFRWSIKLPLQLEVLGMQEEEEEVFNTIFAIIVVE